MVVKTIGYKIFDFYNVLSNSFRKFIGCALQPGTAPGEVKGGVDKKMPTRKLLIVCNAKLLVPSSSCAQKFLGRKY